MAEIPTAPVTRLMRNAGAERVSEDASQALVDVLDGDFLKKQHVRNEAAMKDALASIITEYKG